MSLTLASRLDGLEESATLALNARAKQLQASGKTIYNLTAGELATDTPNYIQEAVAQTLGQNKYTPVAGLPELREAIAKHARQFYGLDWIQPKNVVVTGGAKPAIYASFLSLLNPGDEVIVPVPSWMVSYRPLIELAGGKVVEVPLTDDFDLDIQAIEAAITLKTKAIAVNSPSNPTGSVFSAKKVKQLADLLCDTDITVIADDIYSKLVFTDNFMPVPTVGFSKIIIINGFSKSQAITGWRIGYLIADQIITDAANTLLSHITGNASLPAQYAGLEAMARDDQPPASTMSDLKRRRDLVSKGLDEAGITYQMPGGAFYFLLDVRKLNSNSAEWCEKLLTETGVALVPGEPFGAPGFVRLTFVADDETLKAALEQIKKFVKAAK
jgi:aspartate aminotransferase